MSSALHRRQTSALPKADKPHRNKQEGQNEAEKKLAGADHDVIDVVGAKVKRICGQHNRASMILSRANARGCFF